MFFKCYLGWGSLAVENEKRIQSMEKVFVPLCEWRPWVCLLWVFVLLALRYRAGTVVQVVAWHCPGYIIIIYVYHSSNSVILFLHIAILLCCPHSIYFLPHSFLLLRSPLSFSVNDFCWGSFFLIWIEGQWTEGVLGCAQILWGTFVIWS